MNTPQGPVAFAFGGLTKLEHGALLIDAHGDMSVAAAVDRAQAVLDECAKRQATPQPEPAK